MKFADKLMNKVDLHIIAWLSLKAVVSNPLGNNNVQQVEKIGYWKHLIW